jgi:hypothetical protein
MSSPLEKDFDYFVKNHAAIVAKYNGKYVVIHACKVIGAYDRESDAIKETTKTHALGTFLVQLCRPGTESYTQVFHSRVMFAK